MLRAAEIDLYQFFWTEEILDEVQRSLVARGHTNQQQAQRLVDAIRDAFRYSNVVGHTQLISAMTNDPKDRHVAAAAVAARAQVIVTSNLADFPDEALAPFGIEVQSPDVFLTRLFHLDPAAMVGIIEYQAAFLRKPPMEVERILDKLLIFAPEFVRLVREYRA